MNKSFVTNVIAAIVVIVGYFSPIYANIIMMTGLFALSGGITNWLAVYMLFEKIPLLYGSGVIPNRFEEFKLGIKNLIIQEFFTHEHIERFINRNKEAIMPIDNINERIDFNKVFEGIVEGIENSPMGSFLGMLGGKEALLPMKDPIIEKLKGIVSELISGSVDKHQGKSFTEDLISKVEEIIDNRLEELTPGKVKQIIQKMIRKHLGWLVVWGGVFGGLIGFVIEFMFLQ